MALVSPRIECLARYAPQLLMYDQSPQQALYVQMGSGLPKGGPAGLFIGFVVWGVVMLAVNECFAEMVTYTPVAAPFVSPFPRLFLCYSALFSRITLILFPWRMLTVFSGAIWKRLG